jgi:hypothetical protein
MIYHDQFTDLNINSRRKWEMRHPEEHKRRQHIRWKNKRDFINSLKDKPCADCGIKYAPWIMQFDHLVRSTKEHHVGSLVMYSKKRVLKEAAKCEVVCANCHADRSYRNVFVQARKEPSLRAVNK